MTLVLLSHDSTTTNSTTTTTIHPLYPKQKLIMDAIRLDIDKTMGNGTSNLILKTIKHFYQIGEEDIIRQLKLFVDNFVKIIGKDAANIILDAVLDEMKNRIAI